MGYQHISNLYKEQEILMFKECYALEKIHGCVHKNTKIMLGNGTECFAKDIKLGSMLLSYDCKNKKFIKKKVKSIIIQSKTKKLKWFKLKFDNGRELICTEDHPILTANRGWVIASKLKSSDDIVSKLII